MLACWRVSLVGEAGEAGGCDLMAFRFVCDCSCIYTHIHIFIYGVFGTKLDEGFDPISRC